MAYTRKTRDVWEIQVNYGYGWECETAETSAADAKAQAKCYRENVHFPVRIVKRREPIEGGV